MKLGKRLKQIESLITSDYEHIWDCCCDHGLLGMSLLAKQVSAKVHFVDIVPELMSELDKKLQTHFVSNTTSNPNCHVSSEFTPSWQTHCLDVATLPLNAYSGKHLVIIAGVGGDQTSQFIRALCEENQNLEMDFLLCPVHHLYTLRQQLINLKLSLQTEILVEENNRHYELMLISKLAANSINKTISPAGDQLWHCENSSELKQAQSYLNKTLNHYQRMQQGLNSSEIDTIIQAYKKIEQQLIKQTLLLG